MKHLNNINEYITLYLNDLEDYGDNNDNILLAESVLNGFKSLITESKGDVLTLLNETISKAPKSHKQVYQDFMEYLENI
jgi:hypothetical protein